MYAGKHGRCVHCLGYFAGGQLTDDHVVPNSWYPTNTPPRSRPVAPSCVDCNRRLGKIERALGVRLGLGFSPEDPQAGYFAKSAARAVNPHAGANPNDAKHRYGLGKAILSSSFTGDRIPSASIVPGFERNPEADDTDILGIGLEKAAFDAFGEKLIRGSSFVFSRLYIELGHEITVMPMPRESNPFLSVLDRLGRSLDLAPGIGIRRAGDAAEDPACGMFEFRFWDRFFIYGIVSPSPITVSLG